MNVVSMMALIPKTMSEEPGGGENVKKSCSTISSIDI